MRKTLTIWILAIVALMMATSCQKGLESFKKNLQTSNRSYTIEQYSGGVLIGTYEFVGTLNDAEGSDGYYFYNGDTPFELSGDLIIKSTRR